MEMLDKKISWYWLIGLCIVGLLVGVVLADTVSVWSNVVSTTIYAPPWSGITTLSPLAQNYTIGQPIALSAQLTPLPTTIQNQQNVTFYYSAWSNISALTPITENATTGLSTLGSVITRNGIAQLTLTPAINGTFYFIATVPNPT